MLYLSSIKTKLAVNFLKKKKKKKLLHLPEKRAGGERVKWLQFYAYLIYIKYNVLVYMYILAYNP